MTILHSVFEAVRRSPFDTRLIKVFAIAIVCVVFCGTTPVGAAVTTQPLAVRIEAQNMTAQDVAIADPTVKQRIFQLPLARTNQTSTVNINAVYDVPAGQMDVNPADPNNHVTASYLWSESDANATLASTVTKANTLSVSSTSATELSVTVSVHVKWWPGTGEVFWEGDAQATFKQSIAKKKWSSSPIIGETAGPQGIIVQSGQMTAPQNQTLPNPARAWVFPGSVVACKVDTALDSDNWAWRKADDSIVTVPTGNGGQESTGTDGDTIDNPRDYVWTGADFITGQSQNPDGTINYTTAPTVTGPSARALAPAFGNFTVACVISNNYGKAVPVTDSGARKDSEITRQTLVTVTTASAALEVHHVSAAATSVRPEQTQIKANLGGNSNYAMLVLDIGGGLRVGNGVATLRL